MSITSQWIIQPYSLKAKQETAWEEVELTPGTNLVGRMYAANIQIPSMNCSRSHGELVFIPNSNALTYYDRSTRGTLIQHRGMPRTSFYKNNVSMITLRHGDWICFGGPNSNSYDDWSTALWYRVINMRMNDSTTSQSSCLNEGNIQQFARSVCTTPTI